MAVGGRLEEQGARAPATTVFLADASSEADAFATALRAAGHTVVDVLSSMLVARVAVQHPRVVVVDADAEGALEVVERMRELPDADDIHVLFIARPGGAISSPEEALAHEASGLFVRPVDVRALVQRVHALSGAQAEGAEPFGGPSGPTPPSSPRTTTSPPSLPPASMRASFAPPAVDAKPTAPLSPRPARMPSEPPAPAGASTSRRVAGLAPPVSSELLQLLAEAEQRVHVQMEPESLAMSPEEEIEAVLPADLLAALDEPLDEDVDDDEPMVAPRPSAAAAAAGRERSTARAGARSTPARTTAGAPAPSGTPSRPSEARRQSDAPPSAHTQGGTHAGPTGESVSTTGGGSEPLERPSALGLEPIAKPSTPSPVPVPVRKSVAPPRPSETVPPITLGPGDAMLALAQAVAGRTTGSMCVVSAEAERRVVLREGDVVTTSSTAEDESLLAFLGVRGDLPRETVRRLGAKFPPYGRHAGAALVARGYVRQDQMWPTLRAHAEWLFARALQTASGRLVFEPQPPGRLGGEPSVFGGSTGASVFVEVVRRIVPPAEAVERLGGLGARIEDGLEERLLVECGLDAHDLDQVRAATGHPVRDAVEAAPDGDLMTVTFALWQLGVVRVAHSSGPPAAASSAEDAGGDDASALDAEAVRERVRARLQLVEDGDYFALLGVSRDATGYEVRRAFLELRRGFDASRLLTTPDAADLAEDVRKIAAVLEEAYDILKDAARRERYRRAIEAAPDR